MAEEGGGSGSTIDRKRRVESLGWLTESTVMPRKQRAIEGVSAASIVELRAQLYKSQEDHSRHKEGLDEDDQRSHRKGGSDVAELFARRNAGVEDRAERDRLQLKSAESGADSYAALEKKAQLYEKLVKGELPDEEELEKYSVDFVRKGSLEEEREEMEKERDGGRLQESSSCGEAEDNVFPVSSGGRAGSHHKELIREVALQTKEAREKATVLKQQRQLQAEKKRERLKQAFLTKQMEKLQAAKEKAKKGKEPGKKAGPVSSSAKCSLQS